MAAIFKKAKNKSIFIVKTLIYQENPILLESLDFDDDDIFLEPLLFAYFNGKKENLFPPEFLKEILQGYFLKEQPMLVENSYDKNGIAYIPNVGYFKKNEKEPFEKMTLIENTKIELLKYPVKALRNIFQDSLGQPIQESKIRIDKELITKFSPPLNNAILFIKQSSPKHFELIESCCKKIVLFRTDPVNTNSFATINAHGIAFFNVFQEDYDEVYFVDDIAHQTGHIILTTLFFDRKSIFKVDENQLIAKMVQQESDHRSFYILFHALYTYYSIMTCLDNSLSRNLFSKNQTYEAIARIGFYRNKYFSDIEKFERFCAHFYGIENVLQSEGVELYSLIKANFFEIDKKFGKLVNSFSFNNQPYNFTFKKFMEINQDKIYNT